MKPMPDAFEAAHFEGEPVRCYCGRAIEADTNYCSHECAEEHYRETVEELLAREWR